MICNSHADEKSVCFIFSLFPPIWVGGVEKYIIYVSEGLHKYGFSVGVLTRFYPPLPKREACRCYRIYRIGFTPFPFTTKRYISGFIHWLGDRFTYTVLGFYEAIKIVNRYSIIHSNLGSFPDIVLGAKLAKKLGKKYVVTIHGKFGCEPGDIRPQKGLIEYLGKADFIISNRKEAYEYLVKHGLENVAILENAIPIQKYKRKFNENGEKKQRDKVRVLFLGRLTYRRGAHLAVQAFIHAIKRNPSLELWVVGDGSLKPILISLVKKLGLQDKVFFFGKQLDPRPFLWASDIFLVTSPIANSPSLSLREAMAAGLAVIATDVESTSNLIIHSKTGLLVPVDPIKIGEAIVKLAEDKDLRKRLAKAATLYAEKKFSIENYIQNLIKIYDNMW